MSEAVNQIMPIRFQEEELILSAQRVLYYPAEKTLVISDVHLGKAGHFRRYGIPIPTEANQDNLSRLSLAIAQFNPERVLFLGDLFHSETNSEWDYFKRWRLDYSTLEMTLILGNHELYSAQKYEDLGLHVLPFLDCKHIRFLHDKKDNYAGLKGSQRTSESLSFGQEKTPQELDLPTAVPIKGSISGHLHPGIKIKGKGRQRIILPCFVEQENELVIPAFGTFTGLHLITNKEAHIIAIAEHELISLRKAT